MSSVISWKKVRQARRESGDTSVPRAIGVRGTNAARSTNETALTERDTAEMFSAVVLEFSAGHLAQAARRSKETAKGWKTGRACPNAASLINMARSMPAVRNWMLGMLGTGNDPQFNSPQVLATLFNSLQSVAAIAGPGGEAARALLAQMGKPHAD